MEMFSSPQSTVLPLRGTSHVELANLVLLVTDAGGPCSVTPLSSTKVCGAGKPFGELPMEG